MASGGSNGKLHLPRSDIWARSDSIDDPNHDTCHGSGKGAVPSKAIKEVEKFACEDIRTEATWRILVKDLPTTVAADIYGIDHYAKRKAQYKKTYSLNFPSLASAI